jgi:hypothetical protein
MRSQDAICPAASGATEAPGHSEPIVADFCDQPWREKAMISVLADMVREFRAHQTDCTGVKSENTAPKAG